MKDQTSPSVDQNVDHPPSTPCNDVTMQPCNHSPSPNPFIPESNNPSIQPTATPLIHSPTSLHLFTEAAILQQIGTRRLAKFLAGFNGELPPALAQILAALSDHPATDHVSSLEVAAGDA